LGWNLSLTVNYVYMQSKGIYLGIANQVNVDGLRVAIGWAPQRRRAPATLVDAPEDDK
jgi:hypothetical protein